MFTEDGRIVGRFVCGKAVNLSQRAISDEEIRLLSKGLMLSPVPVEIDGAKMRQGMEEFKQRMRLRWYFKDKKNEINDYNKFKPKSSWNPPKDDPLLESYLSLLEKKVLSLSPESKSFPNLSSSELYALKSFKSDYNVVIKEADKGSAVVVWDRGDYIMEADRQLNDRQVYEEIEVDPTVELVKTINNRLQELRAEVPGLAEVTDYLQVKDSKLGRFYLLPKIHKGLSSVKGRPVISNCGTITEHISEYLDYHLNTLVGPTRSYVKDTNHLLARLDKLGKIPEGALICTFDVVGLYPSIPYGEGLEAIREALDKGG